MAGREFEIEIGRDGKVKITPHGIKGQECSHWAEIFEEIVGKVESRVFTHEYYEARQGITRQQDLKQRR